MTAYRKKPATGGNAMSSKPFTKKQSKRLFRVCDVVKEALLGIICCSYEFQKEDGNSLAASYIIYGGWRGRIVFYDSFFKLTLQTQIETIVHEFIHLAMQPLDQCLLRICNEIVPPKDESRFDRETYIAREIIVDRLAGSLTPMLMPQINKAL